MSAVDRLDQIEARDATWHDVPALVAALRAVLELHKITERCGDDQCSCRRGYCNGCGDLHPCPTVRAIEEALS